MSTQEMIQRRQEAEAEQERRQAEREAKERRMEAVMKTKERPAYFFSKKSRRAEQFQVAAGEAEAQRKATAKISGIPHSQPYIQGEQPHKASTKERMRQMMRARLKMAVEPPSSTNEQLQSVTSVDYSRGSAPRQKASNRDLYPEAPPPPPAHNPKQRRN